MKKYYFIILSFLLFTWGCEKEITVNLPEYKSKLVIEGSIETGTYAEVKLSKSIPYFEPIDTNAVNNILIGGDEATVIVSDNNQTDTLTYFNHGGFKIFKGTKIIGEAGKTYYLKVIYNGKTYTATTTIPYAVPIDSIKFYPDPRHDIDTLGFLWIYAKDPDTLGNNYRILSKTLGKDFIFVHPDMSVDEDKFYNGQTMEFSIYRGRNIMQQDLYDEEGRDSLGIKWYYFVMGETVVVKFCSLDRKSFMFWHTAEQQQASNGNPFASPVTPYTNINGGALGIWGGYGVYLDTVHITPDIVKR